MKNIQLHTLPHSHFLPSAEEMAIYDTVAISGGLRSLDLMERAGEAVFQRIKQRFNPSDRNFKAVILCGPGNNGGDGLVVARMLKRAGYYIDTIVTVSERYTDELRSNVDRLFQFGGDLWVFPNAESFAMTGRVKSLERERLLEMLKRATLVVDALLGTGQQESPRKFIKDVIETVLLAREQGATFELLSIDVPTGIDADSGERFVPHLSADTTVTIECVKRGLLQYPGRLDCGKMEAVGIGILPKAPPEFALSRGDLAPLYSRRRPDMHKGDAGKVLVLAGSRNMPGASLLAAKATIRSGAGIVYRAVSESGVFVDGPPELILRRLIDVNGNFSASAIPQITDLLDSVNAVVLGPGIGVSMESRGFVERIIPELARRNLRTVIDADALNILAETLNSSLPLSYPWAVLTPHPGEMAKLLQISVTEVQRDRYKAVRELYKRVGSTCVLKGASSITYGDGHGVVNPTGNPFMATAGSGDVLSGIIAAFLAEGLDTFSAAELGVYIHGSAGDLAIRRTKGPIIASDILEAIPESIGLGPYGTMDSNGS